MTPYLTLESNEYQTYMLKFASNVIQKLCDLLGVIKRSHRITGSRSRWAKKDHTILERSLILKMFKISTNYGKKRADLDPLHLDNIYICI